MELKQAFGLAFKQLRTSKGLSQEAVGASQSYISDVERGIKSPTIDKLAELATNMGVHPLTILAKSYLIAGNPKTTDELIGQLRQELERG
ncbi:transcriptional regulator [Pseudomonas taiwanensis]|uniref:helix-turn-helix domain-containing protein n=1 Tax=Pseudomonas taiwanensis TaxID=470150 RepID=UPI0015BBA53F|nr:helix-turn-helix transcriptional regulator [Pseudomonas taiwanensis]NWL77286.1 transcriptional regulator [Pseudomonas taiwanensis]